MNDLSYQLYSSRDFPPLVDTLKMLSSIGYSKVEGYGGLYDDIAGVCSALFVSQMQMPTGHFGLDMLSSDMPRVLDIAKSTGMKALYCPHLTADQRPRDAVAWQAFGGELQRIGTAIRQAGLTFGWHNHDFEFQPLDDGSLPIEHLLEGGPDLSWEADLAWIVRAGAEPLDWIARYGDRISAVHIKDIAPEGDCLDEDGWADVGHGTMDWPALLAALRKTPVQHFIMEHDKPRDHARFAQRSFDAIASH